ncbi:unnamed protein product [Cuscuta campestris]|uniref:Uncharacterized protein n=1 Tax=Cuscuta campestris TaxID=132261 RepID=A0A484LU54_9ASTE|nr:unnamed protein product [Cuscuta campestris]
MNPACFPLVMMPFRELEEASSGPESNPTDAVIFVGISLVLGIACRHLLRGTRVPYTVSLLFIGIGLGALDYGKHNQLGMIGNGIRIWANIDPYLLLAVFLPALLFESSFSMEVHQIKSIEFLLSRLSLLPSSTSPQPAQPLLSLPSPNSALPESRLHFAD